MGMRNNGLTFILGMVLAAFLAGCGLETVNLADTVRPVVTSTTPAQGATGVSTTPPVTATFSKAMTASTLNASTFLLSGPGGVSISGTISYTAAGNTATFSPASSLSLDTTYVATITTGAQDTATPANSLAANYIWTFTTAAAPVAPTVISTQPADGATNVAVSQALSAAFSVAMNPATLNTTTFTVTAAGSPIAGTVTYTAAGNIATFTPAATLPNATTLVATINTGAQNTAGTALADNYTWTFTTAAAPPPPVSPTILSTTPPNAATGVPVNQAISATFSTAMNAATINGASFSVTDDGSAIAGTVSYNAASDVATFTPTASLPASTTLVATITSAAQSSAGTALASNYTWTFTTVAITPPSVVSTNPANEATTVALTTVPSATFSTAMTAATVNSSTFTITGPGGRAVEGSVSYNTATLTGSFTPAAALAASTTYVATITTGAQNTAGTALANSYSWTFTTVPGLTPPTVTSTNPLNNATNAAIAQTVSATFSTAMNATTLNGSTFLLQGPGGTAVEGTVTYTAGTNTATITPAAHLAYGTTYIATITTGAQDSAGTSLASLYTFSFTTVPSPAPPTVLSTVPANGATGVLPAQAVSATFSAAMNPATLNTATFTLASSSGQAASGAITYNATTLTATFTPAAALLTSTTYVATITTGAQSVAGAGLTANYVWVFRTAPAATPPTVISTVPANDAAGVALNQGLSATFSDAMNGTTLSAATFTVTAPGGVAVAGTVGYTVTGSVATFTPTAAFAPLTTYVATITTGAEDLAGTALAANYVWTFTTGAAPDTTRPTVIATNPVNGETGVPFNQAISAIFSKALDPATITTTSFTLASPGALWSTAWSPTRPSATRQPSPR